VKQQKKIIYSAGGFAANLKSSQGMILHQPITRKAKKIQKFSSENAKDHLSIIV